jgi:hypothetical protein
MNLKKSLATTPSSLKNEIVKDTMCAARKDIVRTHYGRGEVKNINPAFFSSVGLLMSPHTHSDTNSKMEVRQGDECFPQSSKNRTMSGRCLFSRLEIYKYRV